MLKNAETTRRSLKLKPVGVNPTHTGKRAKFLYNVVIIRFFSEKLRTNSLIVNECFTGWYGGGKDHL